jgi:DUF4097 and DUF4098 domain-containing protein YvlB
MAWLAGIIVLAGITEASIGSETMTRTFDVKYGGTLTIKSDRGSIEILTARDETVTAEVTFKPRFGNAKDIDEILEDLEITFDQSGKDVTIEAEFKHDWGWFHSGDPVRIHFKVTVPEKYNVDLSTSGGRIKVADLEGDANCTTSGGSLDLAQIDGDVYGRTSGGSIGLKGSDGKVDMRTSGGSVDIGVVSGKVEARTSGGSIKVDEAGGDVTVSTSGGSIYVDEIKGAVRANTSGGGISVSISKQPKSECSLTTSGGGVTVRLADNIKVDVDAKTSGGSVTCDLPLTVRGLIGKNQVEGRINGGGPKLFLRTSGGPIRILRL